MYRGHYRYHPSSLPKRVFYGCFAPPCDTYICYLGGKSNKTIPFLQPCAITPVCAVTLICTITRVLMVVLGMHRACHDFPWDYPWDFPWNCQSEFQPPMELSLTFPWDFSPPMGFFVGKFTSHEKTQETPLGMHRWFIELP